MYVLRDDEELFKWNADKFDQKIYNTWATGGNNRFINGDYRVDFPAGILNRLNVLDSINEKILSIGSMFGTDPLGSILKKYYFDSL